MKYCSKCKKLYFTADGERCVRCGRRLIDEPSHYSPVELVTANGFELERIKAALTDGEVAFSVQEIKKDTGIQILNSAPPENCAVFVPVSDYQKAVEVLAGIGALDENDIEEIGDDDRQKLEKAENDSKSEEMSPRKRFWVRLLSFIGFLLLIAAVVYFTDFLASLLKPLWGG